MVGGPGLLPGTDYPSPAISHFSDSHRIAAGARHHHLTHSAHLAQVQCPDQRGHILVGCTAWILILYSGPKIALNYLERNTSLSLTCEMQSICLISGALHIEKKIISENVLFPSHK